MELEELVREDVSALLDSRLTELVGDDVERELEPLGPLRNRSKRTLQRFIDEVAPTMGAWCFRNEQPNPWADGPLAVLKTVDQRGLLDFAPVEAGHEIATLGPRRRMAWRHAPHSQSDNARPGSGGLAGRERAGAGALGACRAHQAHDHLRR